MGYPKLEKIVFILQQIPGVHIKCDSFLPHHMVTAFGRIKNQYDIDKFGENVDKTLYRHYSDTVIHVFLFLISLAWIIYNPSLHGGQCILSRRGIFVFFWKGTMGLGT